MLQTRLQDLHTTQVSLSLTFTILQPALPAHPLAASSAHTTWTELLVCFFASFISFSLLSCFVSPFYVLLAFRLASFLRTFFCMHTSFLLSPFSFFHFFPSLWKFFQLFLAYFFCYAFISFNVFLLSFFFFLPSFYIFVPSFILPISSFILTISSCFLSFLLSFYPLVSLPLHFTFHFSLPCISLQSLSLSLLPHLFFFPSSFLIFPWFDKMLSKCLHHSSHQALICS